MSNNLNNNINTGSLNKTAVKESNEAFDENDLDSDSDVVEERSSGRPAWSAASDMDDADFQDELQTDALSAAILEKNADLKRRGLAIEEENEEDDTDLDAVEDILALPDDQYPRFTLAKNKARFLRMVSWYKNKQEWLEVAPLSGVTKLFKQQTKELVGIRASKLDYEMELETGTLTPSQRSYRRDELKMCKVHEKMAVNLIARMQVKIKSGRR